MDKEEQVRMDKWLWSVRLYKTRGEAAEACRNGHVTVNGQPAKASREVHLQEVVVAKTGEMTRTFRVVGLLGKRVGAALVSQFAEDLTPPEEWEKRKKQALLNPMPFRPKGEGRPTKKERRDLAKIFGYRE